MRSEKLISRESLHIEVGDAGTGEGIPADIGHPGTAADSQQAGLNSARRRIAGNASGVRPPVSQRENSRKLEAVHRLAGGSSTRSDAWAVAIFQTS